MSEVIWVQFQLCVETLSSPLLILCGTEPVSALTRVLLYCCALSIFFLLDLVSGDLVLTEF